MNDRSDAQLLREYAEEGHESAFREIVARYTDMVYSAALRQVLSPDLAKDVAQVVFSDLVRKAQSLGQTMHEQASLAGWLYRGTRFIALNHIRDDRRRQARERQIMEQIDLASDSSPEWDRLRPVLDDAMSDLNADDREALLLRFFKSLDFHAVGRSFGVSDDAAQKRVSRALEKLRAALASRGVTASAAIATALSANAVIAAPAGLAATLSTTALAGTVAHTSGAIAATKTIVMTTLQKAIVTVTLTAAVGAGIYEARQASQLRDQNRLLQQQQTSQIQQLQQERDDASNRLALLSAENKRLNSNSTELLKLRSEAGRSRQQAGQLQTLQNENRQLRAGLDASRNAAKDATPSPTDSLPKESWAFSGYADPKAALQSFLWATSRGDLQSTLSSLTPDARAIMEKGWEGKSPDQIAAQLNDKNVTGFRVMSEEALSDNEVMLSIYADGLDQSQKVKLVRSGNEWKVDFSRTAEQRSTQ